MPRIGAEEGTWDARIAIWWASTSAPRRCARSSASCSTTAALDIVGIGVAESRGIRRGVIVNLEAAVESIKKAIEEAELMAGVEMDAVHLSMAGPHIKGFN